MHGYNNHKTELLAVPEKLGAQLHMIHIKVAEQITIPVSMQNNVMANKKNILQQCVTSQPRRKKLKTEKYVKTESVLLYGLDKNWVYIYQSKA
jgi:hypothetical protein